MSLFPKRGDVVEVGEKGKFYFFCEREDAYKMAWIMDGNGHKSVAYYKDLRLWEMEDFKNHALSMD